MSLISMSRLVKETRKQKEGNFNPGKVSVPLEGGTGSELTTTGQNMLVALGVERWSGGGTNYGKKDAFLCH